MYKVGGVAGLLEAGEQGCWSMGAGMLEHWSMGACGQRGRVLPQLCVSMTCIKWVGEQ